MRDSSILRDTKNRRTVCLLHLMYTCIEYVADAATADELEEGEER